MAKPRKPTPRGAEPRKPTTDEAVSAMLDNDRLQRLEAYLRAGRRLRAIDDAALREHFIESFRRMADDPLDADRRDANAEVEMEFLARKREPPYDALKAEIAAFCAAAADAAEQRLREDPAAAARLSEGIAAELEALLGPGGKGKAN